MQAEARAAAVLAPALLSSVLAYARAATVLATVLLPSMLAQAPSATDLAPVLLPPVLAPFVRHFEPKALVYAILSRSFSIPWITSPSNGTTYTKSTSVGEVALPRPIARCFVLKALCPVFQSRTVNWPTVLHF